MTGLTVWMGGEVGRLGCWRNGSPFTTPPASPTHRLILGFCYQSFFSVLVNVEEAIMIDRPPTHSAVRSSFLQVSTGQYLFWLLPS